nr:hypothetical protein [Tanacetum cinerariifolium]
MIPKPGDQKHEVPVNETFHEQTDDELTKKELKQVEADDQAIQTILLGSDIGIQEKKAKLFNEWKGSLLLLGNQLSLTIINSNGNGYIVAARAEGNANGYNGNQIRCHSCKGLGHLARNYTVRSRRMDADYLQT